MTQVSVNDMYNVVGDDVVSASQRIRRAGDEMYAHLRSLFANGHLEGEGIQQALEASQNRWNAACDSFANAEQRFGQQCHSTYTNTMATDRQCGGYF